MKCKCNEDDDVANEDDDVANEEPVRGTRFYSHPGQPARFRRAPTAWRAAIGRGGKV